MVNKSYEIDLAMNMIKENIIRELSESISEPKKPPSIRKISPNSLSLSEKTLD